MANYVKATNFAVKDSLLTGNPAKLVKGTEIDTEFNAIASAIATKVDTNVSTLTLTNLTTDNFTVGTQTNKASISYTTNTARTLTIPALSGNRTFAFLNEAQIFTADQSFDENVVIAKNCTIEDNLVFSGAGTTGYNRIIGNTADATENERLFFQDGATNTVSYVNVMPNGTATEAAFMAYNNSTPGNASVFKLEVNNTVCRLRNFTYGTGSALPLTFEVNGSERMRVALTGEIYIAGTTDQGAYNLQVNGTGVWGAGAYVNGSDVRLKDNVISLGSALDDVMKLNPVTFTYKPTYSSDSNVQTGFIAQELQEVFKDKNFVDGLVTKGPTYLNVAYQNLIPVLTKAIQELKQELDDLKSQLKG